MLFRITLLAVTEMCPKPNQPFKMKLFAKIVIGWKPLTIFTKRFTLGIRLGSKCASVLYTANKRCSRPEIFCINIALRNPTKFTRGQFIIKLQTVSM